MVKYELSYQPAANMYIKRELYDSVKEALAAAERLEADNVIQYDAWEIVPCIVNYIKGAEVVWREARNA